MQRLARPALRSGLATGLAAAAAAWLLFIGAGGAGMRLWGTPAAIAIFLVEVMFYAYAGFRLVAAGHGREAAAQAGLVAGLAAALASGFPRTALLLLNQPYMQVLQHSHAGHPHLPWPPLVVLYALLGAVLAGAALGAACGSIGGSIARATGAQLP